ncbi:MAG: putative toxin-antitoxin system toxin component, PIN family [Chloroflexi bacterium HGW-Chloroflexi-2]|jgi:putative PIN family toxin of toxin-antitoxin system|nr:MAG: putative toxin-antitoxin system toxin component, PIN family [Chloroflexi bacterium HGW-Chloroflexi-2]
MLIVLDTNVLVSGLLKRNSKPEQIIDAILMRKIHLVIDERVFKEYQDVLHRPKLNIPKDRADAVLSFIAFSSVWIECTPVNFSQYEIIDEGDIPFAELAINKNVILISGNFKHFQYLQRFNIQVLSPDEFLSKHTQIF